MVRRFFQAWSGKSSRSSLITKMLPEAKNDHAQQSKTYPDHDFTVSFCINEACLLYGKKGKNNIRMKGHCGKDLNLYELICTCCHKAFSENYGTPFYNSHLPQERVLDIARHLLEGCGIRGTARLLGHHSALAARLKDPLDALHTSDPHGPYRVDLEGLKTTEEARRQEAEDPGTEAGAPPYKPGMVYAKVKKTCQKGLTVQVERTQEMGTQEDLRQRLDESPVSNDINTSLVERLNNKFRQDVRCVTRKTLSFS
ncbi:MAG: hypothetical protein AB2L14_28880 [Candidatus Xenobiia bacterium LiM19]